MSETADCIELESLIQNISGGIEVCKADAKYTLLYFNAGFSQLLGYSDEEIQVMGNHCDLVYPEDVPALHEEIARQIKNQGFFSYEYRMVRKDGSIIWVLDKGTMRECNGQLQVQRLITDITEQKKREIALRIIEKKYEIAIQFSGISMFEYDVRTHQLHLEAPDIITYNFPSLVEDWVDTCINSGYINEESIDDFRELYHKIDAGEPFASAVIHISDPSGHEGVFELSMTNMYDANGKPTIAVGVKRDISEQQDLEREKQFGTLMTQDQLLAYEANINSNKLTFCSKEWRELLGVPASATYVEMIAHLAKRGVNPDFKDLILEKMSIESLIEGLVHGHRLLTLEYQGIDAKGDLRWYRQNINVIQDKFTDEVSVRSYVLDIDEAKEREHRILEEQKYYESMVAKSIASYTVNVSKNIALTDHQDWDRDFGINREQSYSMIFVELLEKSIHPDERTLVSEHFSRESLQYHFEQGRTELVCEYRRPYLSEFIWVRNTAHLFKEPQSGDLKALFYIENIHESKVKALEMIYKSEHDLLTGLYNRAATEHYITEFLNTSEGKIGKHAYLIMDVDHFKSINDNFGHAFGDVVLSKVAAKISELFRDDDILGRIGGDEFVMFMRNIQSNNVALAKAHEVCTKVLDSYTQNGQVFNISASIGIAFYGEHGISYDELYKNSDTALYISKKNNRNRFTVYSDNMVSMESATREILPRGLAEVKTFDQNVTEWVFRILYESQDKVNAVDAVLELIGKHYHASRAYIFENSIYDDSTSNTFEWCSPGIAPQKENLQNIPYTELGNYKDNFNSSGVYFLPDVVQASPAVQEVLQPQGIKSMLQFSITKNGVFKGFIGFDECYQQWVATKKEVADLSTIAHVLGVFLMEMRASDANEEARRISLSIINGLGSYAYVCDPDTYTILFINQKTLELAPNVNVGDFCYQALWNRTVPCETCPLQRLLVSDTTHFSLDLYNTNLNVWVKATASWIDWHGGAKKCLVESVDITSYLV